MDSPNDPVAMLADGVADFMHAINDLSVALKECREANIDPVQVQEAVMAAVPEEDRPAFQQQWPMISMLLSSL